MTINTLPIHRSRRSSRDRSRSPSLEMPQQEMPQQEKPLGWSLKERCLFGLHLSLEEEKSQQDQSHERDDGPLETKDFE